MRIVEFQVKNFRSLRDVRMEGLGEHVVLYGPNGAGKSNLLAAVEKFWAAVVALSGDGNGTPERRATVDGIFDVQDVSFGEPTGRIEIVAMIDLGIEDWMTQKMTLHLVARPTGGASARIEARRWELRLDGEAVDLLSGKAATSAGRTLVPTFDWRRAILAIPAIRTRTPTSRSDEADPRTRCVDLAMRGHVEHALFVAQTSPDLDLLHRLERVQAILQDPPLSRPPFRPTFDEASGRHAIQEIVKLNGKAHGVSLDLAGLGIQQVYSILVAMLLSGSPVVTLEEPEAHLYERGTAQDLRKLLLRLVPDPVHQLWTATHSSIFALDPGGFWEVQHTPEGGTTVRRNPRLSDLDKTHVYEPGAAIRALLDALQLGEPDRVVARRPDDTGVTASEMVALLQQNDPTAQEFLKDVTAAAVQIVAHHARRAG